jgi:hypothetical protein
VWSVGAGAREGRRGGRKSRSSAGRWAINLLTLIGLACLLSLMIKRVLNITITLLVAAVLAVLTVAFRGG